LRRLTKVQITDEMINVGLAELYRFDKVEFDASVVVRRLLAAMVSVALKRVF
jgi:hypothetical protein